MKEPNMEQLLNTLSDMQDFFPPDDDLTRLLEREDLAEEELSEDDLEFVVAARADYNEFIEKIKRETQK